MKNILYFFILIVGFQPAYAEEHVDFERGVSFTYPDTVSINQANSRKDPFSLVFMYGSPPFSTSILFKTVKGKTLDEFIEAQRLSQKDNSNIAEKKYQLKNGVSAIEFIKKTTRNEMYYFVFPSLKDNKLYAFWHMTSEMADPEKEALAAYNIMKNSLAIAK